MITTTEPVSSSGNNLPDVRSVILQRFNNSLEEVKENLPLTSIYIHLIQKLESSVQLPSAYLEVLIDEGKLIRSARIDISKVLVDIDFAIKILKQDLNV